VAQFIRTHLAAILIVQGVMAWVPFAYLRYVVQDDVSVMPFLIWHLMGVIPGAWIAGRGIITGRIKRALKGDE
jgi:hypothetical protein